MKAKCLALTMLAIGALWPAVARATLARQTLPYTAGDRKFQSYVVYDDQIGGKQPAVLVFPEWWGLNNYVKMRADQLADMGYVAMAVDIYGDARNTTDPSQAGEWSAKLRESGQMLENARAALDALIRFERVDAGQVAAMGFCFGGAAALKLAFSGASLQSLVVFHGTLFAPTEAEASQIKPPILFLHGSQDPLTPLDTIRRLLADLDRNNKAWQMVVYGGAVHAFTNPNAGNSPQTGTAYHAQAAEWAWSQMKVFFDETFPVDSASPAEEENE